MRIWARNPTVLELPVGTVSEMLVLAPAVYDWEAVKPPPVLVMVMAPEALEMLIPDPAVSVLSAYPDPLPMSN